jgi:hypothetical protein
MEKYDAAERYSPNIFGRILQACCKDDPFTWQASYDQICVRLGPCGRVYDEESSPQKIDTDSWASWHERPEALEEFWKSRNLNLNGGRVCCLVTALEKKLGIDQVYHVVQLSARHSINLEINK